MNIFLKFKYIIRKGDFYLNIYFHIEFTRNILDNSPKSFTCCMDTISQNKQFFFFNLLLRFFSYSNSDVISITLIKLNLANDIQHNKNK